MKEASLSFAIQYNIQSLDYSLTSVADTSPQGEMASLIPNLFWLHLYIVHYLAENSQGRLII